MRGQSQERMADARRVKNRPGGPIEVFNFFKETIDILLSAILRHIESLERYARRSGARLVREELPECVEGRMVEDLITLRARLSPERELHALVHELTHWLAHRSERDQGSALSRTVYEYEAEAVEAMVMERLGLAGRDDESVPTDDLLSCSVTRVLAASRRICGALGLESD